MKTKIKRTTAFFPIKLYKELQYLSIKNGIPVYRLVINAVVEAYKSQMLLTEQEIKEYKNFRISSALEDGLKEKDND